MCGENPSMDLTPAITAGSPPHVRGKLILLFAKFRLLGITPACAGKTEGYQWTDPDGRDHPRMCGENGTNAAEVGRFEGSPPHVRGKRICAGVLTQKLRITPACAGKTGISLEPITFNRDHPRMCGENTKTISLDINLLGSPPHVRGKLPP